MDGSNVKQGIPQFFKILLDESACSLPLPPVFVKKLLMKCKFPQNPTLEITQSGGKWIVKLERNGGKYCFGKGWLKFVQDTKTQVGDFLVFKLTANSTFQVSIFAPNGCEKNFRPASNPTTSTCDCKCCSRSMNVNADEKSTRVTTIEIDDDSDDNNMVDDDDDDGDEIRETASERFGLVEEEYRNPYFEKVLSKSHHYRLSIPRRFTMESGIKRRREIILVRKGDQGRKWRMRIWKSKDGGVLLSTGWLDFKKENKIMEGDNCSFQYFHGDGGNDAFIQVEVVKKVARKRGRPRAPPRKSI